MLVPKEDLEQFNSMVKPFEEEAYDILKSRSRKLKHRPKHFHLLIFYFLTVLINNKNNK